MAPACPLRLPFFLQEIFHASAVIAFALPLLIHAQEFRATCSYRVTDPAGGGVPGADINIKNTETAQVTTTRSGDDGNYQVSFLTPGKYVVSAEKSGFKKAVREGVTLEVAEHGVLDIHPDRSASTLNQSP